MNVLLLTMMSGLLMGSVAVTVNGIAYPAMTYQNPLVYVSREVNRESSMLDENKSALKNPAWEMKNETPLMAGNNSFNNEAIKKSEIRLLNDWVTVFRYVEIYG